jgi:hypothetical protein
MHRESEHDAYADAAAQILPLIQWLDMGFWSVIGYTKLLQLVTTI